MGEYISWIYRNIQEKIFPYMEKEIEEPLTEKQKRLVSILEVLRIERYINERSYRHGRYPLYRKQIGRSFIVKAVYNISTTRQLIELLRTSRVIRRICGWDKISEIPHESSFSRAFSDIAKSGLLNKLQSKLVKDHLGDRILVHNTRDSTAIEARERPVKKQNIQKNPKRKRGRPKKGEEVKKELSRLERQKTMTLEEMLGDLPKDCNVGVKKNSQGYKQSWIGYKLHIDVVDGQIPVSCLLTSASLHDSQTAIPLAEITKRRILNCYDLMDSAYDSPIIREHSKSLGHKPIIDINPRRNKKLKEEVTLENKKKELINFKTAQDIRYNQRSMIERVNGRLKDEFGGRMVRVKGWLKVTAHLMFGILALTADQLLRLVT